jgi:hypothetical protein
MSLQEQRDLAARTRRPPLMLSIPAPPPPPAPPASPPAPTQPTYLCRVFDEGCQTHTTEIATDEDWWMMDEAIGQPARDKMEIWASDESMAVRIYPADEPEAIKLLNLNLSRGHPTGTATFERPDGIELVLRTCDTFQAVVAAHAHLAMTDFLSRKKIPDPQGELFGMGGEHFRVMQQRADEMAELEAAEDRELFAPEYYPDYTVGQAKADQERVYELRTGKRWEHPTPDGPVAPAREIADSTPPLTTEWTEADFRKWRQAERFRQQAAELGMPVTETAQGPVIIAGKYLGGKLVEERYKDVT